MRRVIHVMLSCAMLAAGVSLAKLPPPTPEDQAGAAAKKAKADEQVEKEKAALAAAQDRVVARYKKEGGRPGGYAGGGQTSEDKLPKTVKEGTGGVGPKPGMPQSAEAHSAHVK
jgi:hypothetical protein